MSRKSNEGDSDEGGGHTTVMRVATMATATMWETEMATRLAGNKEGKGKGGKGKCNGNEGDWHQRGQG